MCHPPLDTPCKSQLPVYTKLPIMAQSPCMTVEFACRCGKKLRATKQHAGKRAKCNQCGEVVTIPGTQHEPVQAAPASALPVATLVKKAVAAPKPETSKKVDRFGLDDLLSSELPQTRTSGLIAKPAAANSNPEPVPPGGSRCPNCQKPLSPAAVLCINCGYNLKTGKKTTTFSYTPSTVVEAPKKRPRSRAAQFLVSRLTSWKIWSGLGAMLLSGAWFALCWDPESFPSPRRLGGMAILFIGGGISLINGLFDGDDAQ
jgi:hypothetical protein